MKESYTDVATYLKTLADENAARAEAERLRSKFEVFAFSSRRPTEDGLYAIREKDCAGPGELMQICLAEIKAYPDYWEGWFRRYDIAGPLPIVVVEAPTQS